MSTSQATSNPDDAHLYPSSPVPQSHPDRLAAVARLFGMSAVPVDRCRVLELGCSAGGNLIPMAERHPQSTFVGIDGSQTQIAAARRVADALALANLELRQADLAELGDELGKFDYVIANGVFSWVPPDAQDRLLELCEKQLSERGIALVGYNVLPGWQRRLVLRDVLSTHAPTGAPRERLAQGRALLEFFSTALGQQQAPAGKALKELIDFALRQPDHYIWREYFERENHPQYFHEFIDRAGRFGLQYLGDAAVATMFASNFGPQAEREIARVSANLVSAEQHVDLLCNRAYRQTLLCRRGIPLSWRLNPDRLQGLYLIGKVRPTNRQPDLKSSAIESFARPNGSAVSSPSPPLKAALCYLASVRPRAVPLDELFAQVAKMLGDDETPATLSDDEREGLGSNLIQCIANGVVEPISLPDSFVTTVSPQPQTTPLVRMQGGWSNAVTNRRHYSIHVDDSTRVLLQYLDGEHDRRALVEELVRAVDRGDLSIFVEGVPAAAGQDVSVALEQSLERSLSYLAANALLVA